ncbi:hypothetical protein Taro_036581 [Colocasia esculenta]|uniref:RNase H type-1 domain-containing protein n=1 Tax=Colocasia esculenta TaxID=4460 RepID=A0A843WM24_COLES|nr:hypothetical protein [Colocasia esculenta]
MGSPPSINAPPIKARVTDHSSKERAHKGSDDLSTQAHMYKVDADRNTGKGKCSDHQQPPLHCILQEEVSHMKHKGGGQQIQTSDSMHTEEDDRQQPTEEVFENSPEPQKPDSGIGKLQEKGTVNTKGIAISLPVTHNIRSAPGLTPPEEDSINILHVAFAGKQKAQPSLREEDLNRNIMAPRIVRWLTPPQGRLKLNVDGAFNMTTNEAGGGGILRDHKGNMYCAFANCYKDLKSSLVVEALALRDGLLMCCNKGINDVQVETDSLNLLHIVTGQLLRPWDFAFILKEIAVTAKKVQAAITYVPRESNKVADCLAEFAYSCALLTTWDSGANLPSTIKESYRLDKEGCPSMRPSPPSCTSPQNFQPQSYNGKYS